MNIDLDRITNPPRLAKGLNEPDSGKACAMQVISYITGDVEITDYPACSDASASAMVQFVNDRLAGPYTAIGTLLSPESSLVALELGWLTVGTAAVGDRTKFEWAEWVVDEAARRLESSGHTGRGHLQSARVKLEAARPAAPWLVPLYSGDAIHSAYSAISGFHVEGDRIAYDATAYDEADFVKAALLKLRELMGLDEPPAVAEEDLNSVFDRINAGVS